MNTAAVIFWTCIVVSKVYVWASGSPFFINDNKLTWHDAKSYCEDHDGRLVIIDSQSKLDLIVTAVISSHQYYIGLSTTSTDCTNYIWSNGMPLTWSKWDSSEPDDCNSQPCIKLTAAGAFRTATCTFGRRSICEYENPQTSSSSSTTETTSTSAPITPTTVNPASPSPSPSSTTKTTTSAVSTAVAITPTTSCCCSTGRRTNITQFSPDELVDVITQLKAELSVSKNNTSAYRRTRMSVYDSRPSSMVMGGVACIVMAVVIGWIFVPDLITMCVFLFKSGCKQNVVTTRVRIESQEMTSFCP